VPKFNKIEGDLIQLTLEGKFDVVAHGCNCFCTMGAGIAPQFANAFGADTFKLEDPKFKGAINKLGMIDFDFITISSGQRVAIVNAYTQYDFGALGMGKHALDYEALALCLKKLNHRFKGLHIGLPMIGCGLGGGKWSIVEKMIYGHMGDCDVTVVAYNK